MAGKQDEKKDEKTKKDQTGALTAQPPASGQAAGRTAMTKAQASFDAMALATLTDDQLLEVADKQGGTFVDLWTQIKDKDKLVGRPFVILEVIFQEDGDYDQPYTTIRGKALTVGRNEGYLFVMSDGGAGVNKQLRDLAAANGGRVSVPMRADKGLRVSKYTYTDDDGKEKPAATYYLDGSKG